MTLVAHASAIVQILTPGILYWSLCPAPCTRRMETPDLGSSEELSVSFLGTKPYYGGKSDCTPRSYVRMSDLVSTDAVRISDTRMLVGHYTVGGWLQSPLQPLAA